MPEIQVQHVVSFSSADKNNPADNLLKSDGSHKWKSEVAGEKSVSCVLQFEKCSQIHSIDIGNEGSAFVEILVGKSAATCNQDFEVLLVASSFMTPLDSRNGTNRTSVRMFGPDKLNKVTAVQKWDRVKIVCTQPFCKTAQYGISFIKFHSPPVTSVPEPKKLGAFTLKSASDDDEEDLKVGSLFANRGNLGASPTPAVTTSVRAAGRLAEGQFKTDSPATNAPKTTHSQLKQAAPTLTKVTSPAQPSKPSPAAAMKRPAMSPASSSTQAKKPKASPGGDSGSDTEEEEVVPRPPLLKQTSSVSSSASSNTSGALKRSRTEPPQPSATKELSKLMEGVVFVLSGFQNPYRAQLRDTATSMGARYRPDWGRGCTHLICAFQNTPKYQQVAGKGKIVTKSWITDSHRMKRLMPWRKYRLGDAESPDESSEDEEEQRLKKKPLSASPATQPSPSQSKKEAANSNTSKQPTSTQPSPSQSKKEAESSRTSKQSTTTPGRGAMPNKGVSFDFSESEGDSDGDTDDELRKAAERHKTKTDDKGKAKDSKDSGKGDNKDNVGKNGEDPYDIPTDEEGEARSSNGDKSGELKGSNGSDSGTELPDLPEFFTDKHFFFYGDFDATERRLLTRYVAAYNGEEEEYMSKKVNYVITSQKWDDNFEDALSENSNLVFVKPRWILSCHEKGKLVPYQPFIVVPS